MRLYYKILRNKDYLSIAKEIGSIRFITDGKWDWDHGLGHYKRVAKYVNKILSQLNADERTIDLGMVAALLHDVGLSKGDKVDHAVASSKMFINYIDQGDITKAEEEMLRQAIFDHSKGKDIQSVIGLALVLADKLDVTYHRVENSTIHDEINNEIEKVRDVDISINEKELIVNYVTEENFNVNILNSWPKAVTIPYDISQYLNKEFVFLVNGKNVDISNFLRKK